MFFTDNSLYENFVSPNLCSHLKVAGLCAVSNFKWVIRGTEVRLETDLFDMDEYYKSSKSLLYDFNNPLILPAYTVKDVEKCLPAYLLTKGTFECDYEISLDQIFKVESKKSSRLPDALAEMLLEAIKKNIVSLPRINWIIAKQVA